MNPAVVIPVKSFTMAKGRLADTLSPAERESLARDCATRVVRAAGDIAAFVVCGDPLVAEWARALGARVVDQGRPGLDAAVETGTAAAATAGHDHVIVAHADLPLARSLAHVAVAGTVTIVTDRHHDGTNVLSFPLGAGFTTAYGPGSCDNHVRIAEQLGIPHRVLVDDDLSLDLDTADDLSELARRQGDTP